MDTTQSNFYLIFHSLIFPFRVKLAINPLTGEQVAVKIIPLDHPKMNPRHLAAEAHTLKKLNHPNTLKLIEYFDETDYHKKDGSTYKVAAFVLELAPKGNLLDLLSRGVRINETYARTIFHKLVETIEYCHEMKLAHRDLKPENILFDKNYEMKLADFGFSVAFMDDQNRDCRAVLGTESYMAPELLQGMPYSPVQTDLFALAVTLFLIVSGSYPFKRADANDPYYKLFMKKSELFWKGHERKLSTTFSTDFKNLMTAMLSHDWSKRPSISEIKSSAWYKGPVVSWNELQQEFKKLETGRKHQNEVGTMDGNEESKINEKVNEKEVTKNGVSTQKLINEDNNLVSSALLEAKRKFRKIEVMTVQSYELHQNKSILESHAAY